jgi:hypothetical protein
MVLLVRISYPLRVAWEYIRSALRPTIIDLPMP